MFFREVPRVYILILNWNGWKDTIKCVESLKSLQYPKYEIIVLDNGSTNDSVIRIREAYPDVTLIEIGSNLGFAGGNNVGIRYALDKGADYIWLLNNDTVVDPNALTAMVDLAESDPKVGVVGSILYYMNEPSRVQAWGGGRVSLVFGYSRHLMAAGEPHYITGASMLLRRDALIREGLLDERYFMYWEDADICFRLRRSGWKLAVAENSRVLHKESASVGRKNPRLALYFNESSVRFFFHHAPLPLVPVIIGFLGRFMKGFLRGWQWSRAVLRGTARGFDIC
ncbi:glycosyltransferase family 2 protein [Meiothermus rufus]|uniref:glycosyltransferase family 2 protein n=1 Tax=Meiothermus rufus TaxID=604332 RepID=UPI000A069A72|nr:glycosyltransferase family 2 protein [Meiothermus rufus]